MSADAIVFVVLDKNDHDASLCLALLAFRGNAIERDWLGARARPQNPIPLNGKFQRSHSDWTKPNLSYLFKFLS